jgi:hypothetical protein
LGGLAVALPEALPNRGLLKLAALIVVGAGTAVGLWRLAADLREDPTPSVTAIDRNDA